MSESRDLVVRLRDIRTTHGDAVEAAAEIERLRKLNAAYWQEVENWRKGDGAGDFRHSMREVPNNGPGWSDEALWSYENEGCQLYTDTCRKEAGL